MTMRWTMGLVTAALIASAATADTPDPQHAALATFVGQWEVTQSFYAKPGEAPQIDKGRADFAMVLDGRHLRQSLHIASKTPFEGLGYLGYDPAAGHWFTTWMDVNFSGLILAWGDYDAAAQTYSFTGTMAGDIPLRERLHVTDRDHFSYEYYETHAGKEALAVRLDYARRR